MNLQKRPLEGQNIIITGASRGLGKEIARGMWAAGAGLLLVARSADDLNRFGDELASSAALAQQVHTLPADLKLPGIAREIVAEAASRFGRIDVLVNNAAILGPIGKVWENDWQEWEDTVRVNLLATVELCRESIRLMSRYGRGKIIALSGGGAAVPRANFSAYATAKAGLVRFCETLSVEARDLNIEVNCIAPGMMMTEMGRAVMSAGPAIVGEKEYSEAIRREIEAGDCFRHPVDLCVFLASAASDGLTGKLISAVWDDWRKLPERIDDLKETDIYTLRRIVPADRGRKWS